MGDDHCSFGPKPARCSALRCVTVKWWSSPCVSAGKTLAGVGIIQIGDARGIRVLFDPAARGPRSGSNSLAGGCGLLERLPQIPHLLRNLILLQRSRVKSGI